MKTIIAPLTLRGQRRIAFRNEGQAISIRGLTSDNAVPAVSNYRTPGGPVAGVLAQWLQRPPFDS